MLFPFSLRAAGAIFVFAGLVSAGVRADASRTPPETWQEHWFEHKELLKRVDYNADVAIYFDARVKPEAKRWITPFMTKLWQYTKATYGPFGPEGRLYCIFHEGQYSGGHPSTYFDASHDFRNVSDSGPGPWDAPAYDIPSHEVGHVVEGASNGVHGSPAFPLWHDSKWIEIYQYDAYKALGMTADAQRLFDKFTATEDDFPRAGSHWFRDWYYPIWRDYGHAKVLAAYFKLLAKHYPKKTEGNGRTKAYAHDMNWGEYVHFMSGAAGRDLKPLATKAFGWPDEWERQYREAKKKFPLVRYFPAPR
jgi:hypothetical protein